MSKEKSQQDNLISSKASAYSTPEVTSILQSSMYSMPIQLVESNVKKSINNDSLDSLNSESSTNKSKAAINDEFSISSFQVKFNSTAPSQFKTQHAFPAPPLQLKTNNSQTQGTPQEDYQPNHKNKTQETIHTTSKPQPFQLKGGNGKTTTNTNQTHTQVGQDGTLSRTAQHVMYELVAHGMAYSNTLNAEQNSLLRSWGYNEGWQSIVNDNEQTGLFVGLLLPNEQGEMLGRKPIVAFRGSEMSDPDSQRSQFGLDWLQNDMDPYAVGYTAFMLNYNRIQSLINSGVERSGPTVVVGHSLGGSLASQAAIYFPELITSAITFQSPGINPEQAKIVQDRLNSGQRVPDMTSYTAEGDIVDLAGGGRYPGATRIQIDPDNFIDNPIAHTQYLLSTPEFRDAQNELSTSSSAITGGQSMSYKEMLRSSSPGHPSAIGSDRAPYKTNSNLHEWIEPLRQSLIGEMYHPNADLILNFSDRIASMPLPGRINIMQSLMISPNLMLAAVTGGAVGYLSSILIGGAIGGAAGGIQGGIIGGATGSLTGSALGPIGTTAGGITGGAIGSITGGLSGVIAGMGFAHATIALPAAIIGAVGNTGFAAYRDYNTTQVAINRILLNSSATEKVQIINACGGIDAFYSRLWLANETEFHSNLISSNGYYAGLTVEQGAQIVRRYLKDGGIFGIGNDGSEEIIADLLVNNPNGEAIITSVGNGDYDSGLERILRMLQGGEDRIISSRFQFKHRSRGWFW